MTTKQLTIDELVQTLPQLLADGFTVARIPCDDHGHHDVDLWDLFLSVLVGVLDEPQPLQGGNATTLDDLIVLVNAVEFSPTPQCFSDCYKTEQHATLCPEHPTFGQDEKGERN